jgi:hypothetical protein
MIVAQGSRHRSQRAYAEPESTHLGNPADAAWLPSRWCIATIERSVRIPGYFVPFARLHRPESSLAALRFECASTGVFVR